MKSFKVFLFFLSLPLILSFPMSQMAYGEVKITKEEIVIETPKRKSKGKKTAITFKHKVHAEKRVKGDCKVCHATVKQQFNAPENTKKVLHKVCKSCHKKGKPAEKKRKCTSCHKPN